MKTVYEVQKLLIKFGTVIYTGNRIGDLQLMDSELDELFNHHMINKNDYTHAKLLLRKEITKLTEKKGEGSCRRE
ncbi:YqgQ family protein [Virgibacillus kimchii]